MKTTSLFTIFHFTWLSLSKSLKKLQIKTLPRNEITERLNGSGPSTRVSAWKLKSSPCVQLGQFSIEVRAPPPVLKSVRLAHWAKFEFCPKRFKAKNENLNAFCLSKWKLEIIFCFMVNQAYKRKLENEHFDETWFFFVYILSGLNFALYKTEYCFFACFVLISVLSPSTKFKNQNMRFCSV